MFPFCLQNIYRVVGRRRIRYDNCALLRAQGAYNVPIYMNHPQIYAPNK